LRPIAAVEASSGEITVTAAPAVLEGGQDVGQWHRRGQRRVQAERGDDGDPRGSGGQVGIVGRADAAVHVPAAADRHRRLPILTGGRMPGTAQLATTASVSGIPELASKTVGSPETQSTAISRVAVTGQSGDANRDSITARRSDSATVCALSAKAAWAGNERHFTAYREMGAAP
jgi:hypothetical protein